MGRLVQKFSKDLDQIDQHLPGSFGQLIASTLQIAFSMIAISAVTPSFSIAFAMLFGVYLKITNYYRTVARELKRLDSISRSPIFSHFSETLGGLPIIRSFKRQSLFRRGNEDRLDDNLSAYGSLRAVDRWLSFRLEILGNLIVLTASVLAVCTGSKAGSTGLSLNNALSVTGLLNWAVRNGAETESMMNSVERVLFTIEQTPQEIAINRNNTNSSVSSGHIVSFNNTSDLSLRKDGWPWRGGIVFDNVNMSYRSDLAPVVKRLNLVIGPGQSIGIVGRTGSGKR